MTLMVSADSHVIEPPDLYSALRSDWGDGAPEVRRGDDGSDWWWVDGQRTNSFAGGSQAGRRFDDPDTLVLSDSVDNVRDQVWTPDRYVEDNLADGVGASVLYPTQQMQHYAVRNSPLVSATCRVYNDWLADFCSTDPLRLIGHALIPCWDVEVGVKEMRRARDLGLQGGLIWTSPPADDSFFDRRYDPLWSTAEELAMPIAIHTLAGQRESRALGDFGRSVESSYYFSFRTRDEMQRSLCEMIVAGVFERHPDLRVIGAEGGINYAAMMEKRLDSGYRGFWGKLDHGLTMKPSEYFRRNVFLTYINDEIGLHNLPFTGSDHFMWSGDYPHGASTWPRSAESVAEEAATSGLDDETIRKLTITNCAELYGIDVDAVAGPSPAIADRLPTG